MGTTYCTNAELILDNGKSIDSLLIRDLTRTERDSQKDSARDRAYNKINEQYLRGKTVIPATHIAVLKQVEIDFVIADVMTGAFSVETSNISEWTEKYAERAKQTLEKIRYVSSAETPVAESSNVGDGTISAIVTNDHFTMTEDWVLTALGPIFFKVSGLLSGILPDITVGEEYPDRDWTGIYEDYGLIMPHKYSWETFPIHLTITAGSIAFVQYDRFRFQTYSASFYRQTVGKISRA